MRFAWRCPESSRSVKNWNRKSRLSGVMFIIWRRNSTGWRKNWSTEPEKRKKNGRNGSWKENMEKVSWMRYVRKNGGSIRWRY